MPKADSVVCPNICLGAIITIIILFMTPTVFIPAGEYGKYDRHSCQVERIVYPTELPTLEILRGGANVIVGSDV